MADNVTPSLYTLPVELIYHILDKLDAHTILFSFRNVCKRFNTIADKFNRYELDFKSVSQVYFHRVCHIIRAENILSLDLSDDKTTPGQIESFISLFNIHQFNRLRSLTLFQVGEYHFSIISEHITAISSLTSVTLTFRKNFHSSITIATTPLTLISIIGQANVRKLDLTLPCSTIDNVLWPVHCTLRYLRISPHITLDQFCTILSHSPHLKILVLQDCAIKYTTTIACVTSDAISYPQLISLTFEDSELEMNELEIILSLTPSLVHLQVIGGINLFNGSRWEQFIQTKLPMLKKFEFAFGGTSNVRCGPAGVNSLIDSFRTPFWLAIKHWFVVCYYFKKSLNFTIYTIPICIPNVRYYPATDKLSCSTSPTINDDATIADNVCEIRLNLTRLMATTVEEEGTVSKNIFFRKVTKLSVDGAWPVGSHAFLFTLIELSSIVELTLNIAFNSEFISSTVNGIVTLLKQAPNTRSLIINSSSTSVENVCSMVPRHVKHLQVPVKHVDDMKMILEQLEHLSSVTFEDQGDTKSSAEIIVWLIKKGRNPTYRADGSFLNLWLDKSMNQSC